MQPKARNLLYLFCTLFVLPTLTKASSCGFQGTIKERIEDCRQSSRHRAEYALVTLTENGFEVYLEKATNKLWSSRVVNLELFPISNVQIRVNGRYVDARFPRAVQPIAKSICETYRGEELGYLDLKWSLPTRVDYEIAKKLNLKSIFADIGEALYWTSTKDKHLTNYYYVFNTSPRMRDDFYSYFESERRSAVRCVAYLP